MSGEVRVKFTARLYDEFIESDSNPYLDGMDHPYQRGCLDFYYSRYCNIKLHDFLCGEDEPFWLTTVDWDDDLLFRGLVDPGNHHHRLCQQLFSFLP